MPVHRRDLEVCLQPTGLDPLSLISLCHDFATVSEHSPTSALLFHLLLEILSEKDRERVISCFEDHRFLVDERASKDARILMDKIRSESLG